MKKITILTLLPILFQFNIYAESQYKNLNQMLIGEFEAARTVMNSSTPLELEFMLNDIVDFAKNDANLAKAVGLLSIFQTSIKKIQNQQYVTTWDNMYYWIGIYPYLVKKEIQPALNAINNALLVLFPAKDILQALLAQSPQNILGFIIGNPITIQTRTQNIALK